MLLYCPWISSACTRVPLFMCADFSVEIVMDLSCKYAKMRESLYYPAVYIKLEVFIIAVFFRCNYFRIYRQQWLYMNN